jgi:hypothetical protein
MEKKMTDQPSPAGSQGPIKIDLQNQQMALAASAMSGAVPRIYANGFLIAQTASDFSLILLTNGAPTHVLNVPPITAKSLVRDLGRAVGNFETAAGHELKAADDMARELTKTARQSQETKK